MTFQLFIYLKTSSVRISVNSCYHYFHTKFYLFCFTTFDYKSLKFYFPFFC